MSTRRPKTDSPRLAGNGDELARVIRERDQAREDRSVLARDIALLEQALLDIERAADDSKSASRRVLAIVHRVLGRPERRTSRPEISDHSRTPAVRARPRDTT